ncbi:hypothetical protein PTTG_29483 [Puccinia triticina 1-1 BBBD Race 1]|uniref:Uncharacterized protein n=1 Tax=Puccinia triticina (isolate 1-1 / race 1 (BBBD)) TaxID=630390 RepID=A0A180G3T4_PUCT1|nr:hypothetical protein PTTG_29483 [Puccinia triticina 1-1 BBBD Race 1]
MSHSEPDDRGDTSSKIDKVTLELANLDHQYCDALWSTYRPDENDEMADELIGRTELIDELESSLLPSIRDQITSLLLRLDLQNLGKQLNANLDSISELASKIDQTLEKATSAVQSVSNYFEGYADGRNLGQCKSFRCGRLHTKLRTIIVTYLCPLFRSAGIFMRYWDLLRKDPENSEYRQEMVVWIGETYRLANICYGLTDKAIKWLKNSDLAMLQEDWLEAGEMVDSALEDLTKISADPMNDLKVDSEQGSIHELDSEEDSIYSGVDFHYDSITKNMTPRQRVAHVARPTI